jgi:hypothetical protein
MTTWYLRNGTDITGPLTTDQLKAMGKGGRVTEGMEVAKSAQGPWHKASAVSGLTVLPAATAAMAPTIVHSHAAPVIVHAPATRHVTTEGTSKTIKIQQLIALLMILGGALAVVLAAQLPGGPNEQQAAQFVGGISAVAFGILWRIVLRLAKWWYHE